ETIKIIEVITLTRNAKGRKHILTFLPTRDAVGTGILSKIWERLWMSIISFVFCILCELIYKRDFFLNFVERVLMLRESIDKSILLLHVMFYMDLACTTTQCSKVISCPLWSPRCIHVSSLFSCDSLEDSTLEMSCSTQKMGFVLKLPRSLCFSSLKSLYLKYVTFVGDYSTKSAFQVAQSWMMWMLFVYLLPCFEI
ncbi:putative f-box/fbd/lrr-repeat protein, partial [Quercus suber]